MNNIDANVTAWQLGPVTIMRGTATPTTRVSHPECFGRFTVIALSPAEAIRKCLRRVARMCADCSAREQLDQQEARAWESPKASGGSSWNGTARVCRRKRPRSPCASPSTR